MNNFTTKKIKTQSLGEYLTDLRTRLGYSVEEVSLLTKVQKKHILALETGHFSQLPALVYVKGFLKSLAAIYGANSDNLCNLFLAEEKIVSNIEAEDKIKNQDKKTFFSPKFILSPKTLALGFVIVGFAASAFYLSFQVNSLSRPPKLEIISPLSDVLRDSETVFVKGQTEPGALVYLNDQAIMVDAEGIFSENLSLGPGANQLVIKAVNKFGRETSVSRSLIVEGESQEKEIAGTFVSETDESNLTLEVIIGKESSWISVETDGAPYFSGTLLPGASKTFEAKNRILLSTGNAGSTKVFFNEKDFGVLGKTGETIRDIEFTR